MRGEPESAEKARRRAEASGFGLSSEPEVGYLLAALSAAVPTDGRILELGTGAGVGLAWITFGLRDRTDVTVVTVDIDEELLAHTRGAGWPPYVEFRLGDGADIVGRSGEFDLIFADAPGGKLTALDVTIAASAPRGVLVVDDMN